MYGVTTTTLQVGLDDMSQTLADIQTQHFEGKKIYNIGTLGLMANILFGLKC